MSSGSTAFGSIVTVVSSPPPVIVAWTSPPPALPSTSMVVSSCCAAISCCCICCACFMSCCMFGCPDMRSAYVPGGSDRVDLTDDLRAEVALQQRHGVGVAGLHVEWLVPVEGGDISTKRDGVLRCRRGLVRRRRTFLRGRRASRRRGRRRAICPGRRLDHEVDAGDLAQR